MANADATAWSLSLGLAPPDQLTAEHVAEAADRAWDALIGREVEDAVVTSGETGVAVRFTVHAAAPDEAVVDGVRLWRRCAPDAGMDSWPLVRADAATYDVRREEFAAAALPRLVGVGDVATLLGVPDGAVFEMLDDLPRPVAALPSGPVWAADGVEARVSPRHRWRPLEAGW